MATWRSGLFDRLMPNDLGLSEDDRDKLGRQGLLHLGLGLLSNGGGFGNALGEGIKGGLLAMNQGAEDIGQREYRRDLSARMKANTGAEEAKRKLAASVFNPDGSINDVAYRQYATLDPQSAKALRDATQPDQAKYALGKISTPGGGELPVFFNPTNPGEVLDVAGNPMFGAAPRPITGGGATVLNDAFFQAQEQAESGGNPNAVSPKGAFGPMQIMPATAADPGFGMASLPANATPEQNREFGREYMTRITREMGGDPVAGLMAYNWGIGNAQKAMQAAGGDVRRALASAPRETQQYVSRIMGGQSAAADPYANRPGYVAPKSDRRDPPSGYQWGDDGQTLAPIPGGPADRKNNPTDADMAKGEMGLRKELSDRLKEPRTVMGMFQKVEGAAKMPSAANDLAMIFAYMKMLDPGSVVREQEFANAQNAAGVPDQIRNAYNKALRGERLNVDQRASFVSSARQIANQAQSQITELAREYQGIAEQYGWDTRRATGMPDFRNVQGTKAPASSSEDDDLINKWINR